MRRKFLGDNYHWVMLMLKHNEIEQNHKKNQVLKTKQNPYLCLHVYTLFVHGSALKSRPINIWHILDKYRNK